MNREATANKRFRLPLWLSYAPVLYLIGITVILGIIPNFLSIFQVEVYLPKLLKTHRLIPYTMINIYFSLCFYGMLAPFQYKNEIEKKETRFLSLMNFIPILIGIMFFFTKVMINPPVKLMSLSMIGVLLVMVVYMLLFLMFPVIHLLAAPLLAYLY